MKVTLFLWLKFSALLVATSGMNVPRATSLSVQSQFLKDFDIGVANSTYLYGFKGSSMCLLAVQNLYLILLLAAFQGIVFLANGGCLPYRTQQSKIMQCEVLQYGLASNLPSLCQALSPNLHRIDFPTAEQFDSAVGKCPSAIERKLYKKYKKSKKLLELPEAFASVKTTETGVFLVSKSDRANKLEPELWVYGKCSNWEFGLDFKEIALRVPLKVPIDKKERVYMLSVCGTHAAAVTEKEELYVWGKGITKFEIATPVKLQSIGVELPKPATINYTCVSVCTGAIYLIHNNALYAHGREQSGRLGIGQPFVLHTTAPVPLQLPANTALIRGVACSDKFVMCWDSLGKLYTWGDGQYGRLGLGCRKGNYNYVEYKPTKLEALADLFIVGACCGEDHALAITDQHQVYAWGQEYSTAISYSKRPNRINIPEKPIKIGAKKHLSGILTTEGHLFLWGTSSRIESLSYIITPSLIPDLSPYYLTDFSLSQDFIVVISSAKPKQAGNLLAVCRNPFEYKLYLSPKAGSKPATMCASPMLFSPRPSQDNVIYNNLRALEQVQNMFKSPDKQHDLVTGKLYWEKFIRDKPKRKPLRTLTAKTVGNSYEDLQEILDPHYEKKMYVNAVEKYMSVKKKKKTIKPMTRKQLDVCLQRLRVQNTRKPRIIIKTERLVLSVLPNQLCQLLNRELLLRMVLHVAAQYRAKSKERNINKIGSYMHSILANQSFQRKPRKMMCPDFACIITQMVVVKKAKRLISNRIQSLNKSVRKIQGVFVSYSKIAKLVKSQLSHLFDYMLMTHFKICKGSCLQRVVVQLRNQADNFRKVRITATRLVAQAFSLQQLNATIRRQSVLNELPILPYSKHQFDVSVPEQNKFSLFNKNDRHYGEIRARRELIELMLRANMRNFMSELREYDHSKETFIYTHVDHIDKERARLLLMGKLPMNKNGEYLPFQSIKEKIASKMSTFPKRPDLSIMIIEREIDKWDSEKNNFKKIFKRYVQLVKAYIESKN